MPRQKSRKEIPLRLYAASTDMVALLERFLHDSATHTGLRQLRSPGVDLFDTPPGICSFAGELNDEHPRGADHYAAAEILLKRFI